MQKLRGVEHDETLVTCYNRLRLRHECCISTGPRLASNRGMAMQSHVRIITSTDGRDGMDFLVIGAWFDNHYTLRRGAALLQRHPLHSVRNPTMGAANKIR